MSRADLMGLLLAFIARLVPGAQGHWKGCPPKAKRRICLANHPSHLDGVGRPAPAGGRAAGRAAPC